MRAVDQRVDVSVHYAAKIVRVLSLGNVGHLHTVHILNSPPQRRKNVLSNFKQHNHSYLSNIESNVNITCGNNALYGSGHYQYGIE